MTDANTLEGQLKNQQWVGGQAPTAADKEAWEAVKTENIRPDQNPHTFAWFCLVSKFSDAIKNTWPAGGAAKGGDKGGKKGGKKEEKAAKKDDDDDLDLFGEDNEDDKAAAAAAKAKAEAAKAGKKEKKPVIAQSLVLFEVKPLDDETNLDDVAARIINEIKLDGCYWKTEYKKEPIAFGIFKLIIGVTVEDEKVSVDDLVERIEAFDDMVQSVEIAAFNKI